MVTNALVHLIVYYLCKLKKYNLSFCADVLWLIYKRLLIDIVKIITYFSYVFLASI
jgi:hypothetical protein